MTELIDSFMGEYRFLSNFYPAKTIILGMEFRNSEGAYQACKTLDMKVREQFQELNGMEAKRLGKTIKVRPHWDQITRIECMELCLRSKFMNNPNLLFKLVDTGDAKLIEGNTWGDMFWGQCKGKGTNYLGKLLMQIRSEYQ